MNYTFEEHCTEDALELYALNRLDESSVEQVEEHILVCETCRVRLTEADHFVHAMRNAAQFLQRDASQATKQSWFSLDWLRMPSPTWAATAAAVCAVTIISVSQLHHTGTDVHPFAVALLAQRGPAISAPAHRTLQLKLDARGLDLGSQAVVELTNSRGEILERTAAPDLGNVVEVTSRASLNPGSYFVRLYTQNSNEPLREFALDLK